ncbi:GTP-binding protein, partial [Enterococcus gilvus]|uniref:GTP-binding protein n=1 Tax=Enterococcus gilvus TaxID=160453 RepID=UPI003EDA7DF8
KALTGIETDTTSEEKKRGMSINLGFAYLDMPNNKRVGIVDVPGHEKFIKNMVSGLPGINLVLLVIDAAEGIMPQTKEHIDILTLLGIREFLLV